MGTLTVLGEYSWGLQEFMAPAGSWYICMGWRQKWSIDGRAFRQENHRTKWERFPLPWFITGVFVWKIHPTGEMCGGVLCHDSCPKGTIILIPNLDLRPLWMVLSMFWLSFMVRRSQVAINCVFGSKSVIQHRCSSSPSLSSLAEMFHGLMVRACRKWRCHWGSTKSREREMFNGDAKSRVPLSSHRYAV